LKVLTAEIIPLNVSGSTHGFQVSWDLLKQVPGSKLAEMLEVNSDTKFVDNCVFIDRNPKIFEYMLDYLRTG